jgi:hypothetical protein
MEGGVRALASPLRSADCAIGPEGDRTDLRLLLLDARASSMANSS